MVAMVFGERFSTPQQFPGSHPAQPATKSCLPDESLPRVSRTSPEATIWSPPYPIACQGPPGGNAQPLPAASVTPTVPPLVTAMPVTGSLLGIAGRFCQRSNELADHPCETS